MTLTTSKTIVVFSEGERLAVRLYDTPGEAQAAVRKAIASGTVEAAGMGRLYHVERAAR